MFDSSTCLQKLKKTVVNEFENTYNLLKKMFLKIKFTHENNKQKIKDMI